MSIGKSQSRIDEVMPVLPHRLLIESFGCCKDIHSLNI